MTRPVEPWQEPVRGGHLDARGSARPGAEQLRAMLDGEAPMPPMTRLLGVRIVDAGPGTATFELPLSGWLLDDAGRVPPGLLAMPADAAMACAIMTGLPADTALTTTELVLRPVRPVSRHGRVWARARVIHPDGPLALADAEVRDEHDVLIAHASSSCFIMPAAAPATPAQPGVAMSCDGDGPDPWEREPPPAGGDVPPLGQLTGLRCVSAGEGEATFALPATRWLCAPPPGRLQGGAVAILAGAAMSASANSAAPDGRAFAPAELKLNYVRPLAADGREARAAARVVNAGRRFIVTTAEVRDADDRLIAVVSGSSMAAPG